MHSLQSILRNSRKTVVSRHFIMAASFLLTAISLQAKNYYFSSSDGSDNYSSTQAQNQATPWKSLSKANSSFGIIVAGDSILFKRGDVFYGSLVVRASGNSSKRIFIGAYGTGAKPLFSAFTGASNWTSNGNGIWQCSVPAAKTNLNLVTFNGDNQAMGRYPNADATNGGYLNYETFNGSTSITDNQLPASPNWTGANVVIRKTRWILDIGKITSHSGNTISYANPSGPTTYPGMANFGYFIENDPRTLDELGEWYFNTQSKTLQMFFAAANPSGYNINVSTLDTVINLTSRQYITVDNIAVQGGNLFGIFSLNSNGITIQNCDVNNCGDNGIFIWNVQNAIADNNKVNDILNNGIYVNNSIVTTATTLSNNTVSNVGMMAGMGESGDNTYTGLGISGNNLIVEYNSIYSTGHNALQFQGNNVVVKNNFVSNFCNVKDDGGGIYTWSGDGSTVYTNRTITGNVVLNAIGARYGTSNSAISQDARGIYMDGASMNINIANNSVANCIGSGIFCNNIINIDITGNTVYNAQGTLSLARFVGGPLVRNNSYKNNISFPLYPNQVNLSYWNSELNVPVVTDIQTDMRAMGDFDSNYYRNDLPQPFLYYYHLTPNGTYVSPPPANLAQWQQFMNKEFNSKTVARNIPAYKINKTLTANSVTNGKFDNNISTLTLWSSNNNFTGSWDNTSQISGVGSLKVTPKSSVNIFSTFYAPVGPITAGKSYILKISTKGTTINGHLSASLRQTSSPYATLTPSQTRFFGTGVQNHEFLITPTVSDPNASYIFGIEQSAGVTYVDNIEFYEVDADSVAVESQVRFEYNATKQNKIINLDGNYIGVDGTSYQGSVTLAPFTSKVLILDTSAVAATQLIARAAAPAIGCFGGSTTATVTASGGTAPYSGTGTTVVTAGKGSLKLSFNTPVSKNFALNYWTIGAISSAKSYKLRFTTLGTTTNGVLTAALRQTTTPFSNITANQTRNFDTSRIDHEFVFNNPASFANASFVIAVDQGSGTTYIDNIAVFELDGSGAITGNNLYSGDFETGISSLYTWSSNNNLVATWDTTGKISKTYYFSVKDAKNASSIAILNTVQPSAPLTPTAAAANIATFGGSTTVAVTATGGTTPYRGTGNFSVKAGTYTYTVTDANGCAATTSITVTQPATAVTLTASVAGGAINCFGGSTTATVSAAGGIAPYTGTGSYVVSAGKGSLRLSFNTSVANNFTLNYWTIGAVSSAKTYVLRFSTLGTTSNGVLDAAIRQTTSPFSNITPTQEHTFGTNRVDHQFIFSNPPTTANASFVIAVAQNSGTVYIDNIAFFEANSSGALISSNLYTTGTFESGVSNLISWSSNNNHVATWDTTSKITAIYYYPVTDDGGTINTASVVTSQPSAPLKATASAPNITTSAGSTTVAVTATGGTPPYTGTGNFLITGGTYTYIVTDSKGCTSTVSFRTIFSTTASARSANTLSSNNLAVVTGTEGVLQLSSYPNPSSTVFNLKASGGTSDKIYISVMSFDGKLLYTTTGSSNRNYSFGADFVPGVYTVLVRQGVTVQSIKLIKGKF